MTISRAALGNAYRSKGGLLEEKFIGCVLWMSLQIRLGYYADPNANQAAWAAYVHGCDTAAKATEARRVMEWGLTENADLQTQLDGLNDGALDWITAEYAKTWEAPAQ